MFAGSRGEPLSHYASLVRPLWTAPKKVIGKGETVSGKKPIWTPGGSWPGVSSSRVVALMHDSEASGDSCDEASDSSTASWPRTGMATTSEHQDRLSRAKCAFFHTVTICSVHSVYMMDNILLHSPKFIAIIIFTLFSKNCSAQTMGILNFVKSDTACELFDPEPVIVISNLYKLFFRCFDPINIIFDNEFKQFSG